MKRWKALAGVAAVAALLLTPLVATSASATQSQQEEDKVFVCKYVGTPGDGETLQTGEQPDQSVGELRSRGTSNRGTSSRSATSFTDGHGRSVDHRFDHGQDEPPLSACATTPDVPRDAAWSVTVLAPDCDEPGTVDLAGTHVTFSRRGEHSGHSHRHLHRGCRTLLRRRHG